jgi:hypothetical protein
MRESGSREMVQLTTGVWVDPQFGNTIYRITDASSTLTCSFNTPWLDHFQPPIGTGRGCIFCASRNVGAAKERLMPPIKKVAPPPADEGPAFGDLSFYAAGFSLPEGDYALTFDVVMHSGFGEQKQGNPRLGVMVSATPLTGGEPTQHFYSMGSKAHESFAPNPDTGKGLIAIPGGAGNAPNNKTNWVMLLKSLYDSGMPPNLFRNDLSVIDGVWVHTQNVPEPEERKGFATARTGEVEEIRTPRTVAIVTEIKEGGAPWEGGGGLPTGKAVAAPKAGPHRVAAAAPAPVAQTTDDDVLVAATSAITDILEKQPDGCTKLLMRTGVFKAINGKQGADMAQAVINNYFGSDDALNSVLGLLGYKVTGANVKPAA